MKELSGKNPDGTNRMYRLGHFFFVINPEFFGGLDVFKKTAGDICRTLRASKRHRVQRESTLPERKNGWRGRRGKTKECLSERRSRKNSPD